MNASDRLADLYVARQLILQRLIGGEQRAFNKLLDDISKDLEKMLVGGKALTGYKKARLNKAISELSSIVALKAPDIKPLAGLEANFTADAFAQLGLTATLPSAKTLERIAATSLIEGATIGQWFGNLQETTRFELSRAVKLGVSLGETNGEIWNRIKSTNERGTEVLAKTRRNGMAIVRTSVQTVSNEVRQATFQENADLVDGVQWLATLDGRTSEICVARSGLVWELPDYKPKGHNISWNGGPPAHWNCRSTSIPVLKSLEEMGVDPKDIPPAMRSSMDGQVAADLTFDDFLKSKPASFADEMLGKGRAQLWRDGKITLSQLLDQRGNPLTLAELSKRYDTAAKPMGNTANTTAKVTQADGINRSLNGDTYVEVSRAQAVKSLKSRMESASKHPIYATERGMVYRGINQSDVGNAKLSRRFSDRGASMVLAVMDELDAMADRFGVPKLRGAKTYTRDINTAGAMGDGVLMLNPSWINTYAAATKGGNLEDYAQGLLKKRNDIIAAQRKITNEMSELRPYSVTWNAKSKEFDKLRKELKEVTDDANVALHVKKKEGSLPKRGTVPQGGDQYFTEAFDKFRQLMFHEFGHHVHQTYKKTGRRAVMRPVLERRLIDLWAKDAKGLKERSLSVYGRTNQHEWFAENFASYFMGRRDLVAKEFIEMIEEALNDIA